MSPIAITTTVHTMMTMIQTQGDIKLLIPRAVACARPGQPSAESKRCTQSAIHNLTYPGVRWDRMSGRKTNEALPSARTSLS